MLRFFIKRLLTSLVIVWAVLTLTFTIIHLAPGDPTSLYVRPEIDPKIVENIREQMGLDLPLWEQYFSWIREISKGNFGFSFSHHKPVSEVFGEAILNTLQLTAVVFILQLIFGVILGIIGAMKQNTKIDFTINSILLFLYSMPGFWVALMAILIFSFKLGWLPSSQMKSLNVASGFLPELTDRVRHLILPVLVLTAPFTAYTARFVRSNLCEVLSQNYIRTAKAYGIKRSKIMFKYAFKNALLPVTTLLGLYLPFLLGGSVVTEYIFAWPGMGRITVNAIFSHDFPIILASNMISAIAVVLGNLMSDLLSAAVDPRIKLE